MFRLGVMPKKNFLTYLFNPVCVLITRLVPAKLVIVAIDIGGKEPRRESGYMEICESLYLDSSINFFRYYLHFNMNISSFCSLVFLVITVISVFILIIVFNDSVLVILFIMIVIIVLVIFINLLSLLLFLLFLSSLLSLLLLLLLM